MPGMIGGRPIRVGDPRDPRAELLISEDEAVLLCVGLAAYRQAMREHAAEDGFESHTREEVEQLEAQIELLSERVREVRRRLR
jgi:hypothetical protein